MTNPIAKGALRVALNELFTLKRNTTFALAVIVYPVIIFTILSAVFYQGTPTNLPIGIVDKDDSQVSREIIRALDATPELNATARFADLISSKKALNSSAIYAIVYIPPDTEKHLLAFEKPEITTFYNNQMLTIGSIVSSAANTAINQYSAKALTGLLTSTGQQISDAIIYINPIPVQQSTLFNPTRDYTQFILAALMPTILQIFIGAAAVIAFSRALGRPGGARALVAKGVSPVRVYAGMLLPYLLIFVGAMMWADGIVFIFFDAPFRGHFWLHFFCNILFVATCFSLGSAATLLLKGDTTTSLGLIGIMTAPAFGFAGVSFPRLMMNDFAVFWGSLLPLTSYLQLRTDQAVRGAEFIYSYRTLLWMVLQFLVYTGLSLLLLSKQARAADATTNVADKPL